MSNPTPRPQLLQLGWDDRFAVHLESEAAGLEPGRVVAEDRGQYLVAWEGGEGSASPSGRLRYETTMDPTLAWPAVGDWAALEPAASGQHRLIHQVLPRRTALIRRAPSDRGSQAQVLAANVDTVFVVTSANADFNLRRLERYLAVAWESGARPVILLSKADLVADLSPFRVAAQALASTVDVIAVSVVTAQGLDDTRARLAPGRTVAFVGSSGVGKSSIVNALAGAPVLATGAIRQDDARGRHTTTRRQLVRLAGGLLIDTPGLRELRVLDADGVSAAFDDVQRAAASCRFSDCSHRSEPGCAVQAAIAAGTLDPRRLEAWHKLEREAHRASIATDAVARRAERRRWSSIQRSVDQHVRRKYGDGRG